MVSCLLASRAHLHNEQLKLLTHSGNVNLCALLVGKEHVIYILLLCKLFLCCVAYLCKQSSSLSGCCLALFAAAVAALRLSLGILFMCRSSEMSQNGSTFVDT